MTAPETYTWDLETADGGPRRASLEDVGSGVLLDDQKYPPTKSGDMPYADMLNQWQNQLAGVNKVIPSVKVYVRFTGGTPAIAAVTAMGNNIDVTTFNVQDLGAGDTRVSWPGDRPIPPFLTPPEAKLSYRSGGPALTAMCAPVVEQEATGARVRTWDHSGAATDCDFTLDFC